MSSQHVLYDLHVHTKFSPDSNTPLESYAKLAEQFSFHIGFLDHLELAFLNRPEYLNFDTIPNLLEAYDQVHARYPNTSLGLEVDYYSDLASTLAEFCDDYRNDFDYFIGVVHTVNRLAVTVPEEMELLVQQLGLQKILELYFQEVEAAIHSKLFQGIAHLDGVMRYFPNYPKSSKLEHFWKQRTKELGLLCRKTNLLVEVNLRGLNQPWGKTHPSSPILDELIKASTKFYVGSDSHSLKDFQVTIPQLKAMNSLLSNHNALSYPKLIGRSFKH
ncbi:MAG: histidinol-phosphatase HisJ family protein [Candidatus Thorarchaeota archaeon]